MKKLLLTLIMLLSILGISCEKKPTDPTTNNQNSKVMNSFSGGFTFGNFGNVSFLGIKYDNTIYMTLNNFIIEVDKNMVNKLSDTKYQIKGNMPNIDNNSAAKYSVLNNENINLSEVNSSYIDIELNIINNNLSLSGEIYNSKINVNFTGTGNTFNAKYAGIYTLEEMEGAEMKYEYEVKDNGDVYFTSYDINTGEIITKDNRNAYLIKESDNIYNLIIPVKEFSGSIDKSQAEILISQRALKYYNVVIKNRITFSDNKLIEEYYSVSSKYNDTDTSYYEDAINKVMADTNYLDKIDYSKFKVEEQTEAYAKWNWIKK
ncbi:hypothetical protein [Brachyspira innocens]|uniref:hypothetical protein n=1 Tax=Brachyspira innocens TaxID=13264 RepID=UPI00037265F6|nr:hypothetical protein [Brachyspira innocens]